MKLQLFSPFDRLWAKTDPFEAVDALAGVEFRRVKSRRTFRFEIDGRGFFAKVHHGVGWREIFKNLLQFKAPVLGAGNEYRALELLHQIGVDTMTTAAYGEKNWNPADRDSFLVTEELCDMTPLEDLCRDWTPGFSEKTALLTVLAQNAGQMHRAGLNHRDCYICHFLRDNQAWARGETRLYVIDLHRAQIRGRIPFRYQVKDVAGLFFSALDAKLTGNDLFRFMRIYSQKSLKETLREDRRFWLAVHRAAVKLYQKEFGRNPIIPRIGI